MDGLPPSAFRRQGILRFAPISPPPKTIELRGSELRSRELAASAPARTTLWRRRRRNGMACGFVRVLLRRGLEALAVFL